MTLVSILSLTEMRFIKKVLRDKRFLDVPPTYYDVNFYVHIGLIQTQDYDKYIWENGYYATYFTAWNQNRNSSGNCTRMNFQMFDDDQTWEREDCVHELAEYIMCDMKQLETNTKRSVSMWLDQETDEVKEQIAGHEYDGDIRVTKTGKTCQESCWVNMDIGYFYCMTAAGMYEECSIKLPEVQNSSTVFHKFLKPLSTTYSGKTCQRWADIIPQSHSLHGNIFKGESINEASNFCRDPGDTGFIWCFTTDPDKRWEPCIVNEIKSKRSCITAQKYSGNENKTVTGKTCVRWDEKVLPLQADFRERDARVANNYCRDPFSFGYNWCFINQYGQDWEPCQTEDPQEPRNYEVHHETVTHSMFTCDGEQQITEFARCDGKFDCINKHDEVGCPYTVHSMAKARNVNSNFTNVPLPSSFRDSILRCNSQEFISVIARCDGVIDCLDASDEMNCQDDIVVSKGNRMCSNDQFRCNDGDCIHISLVCNYVVDCIDGSDEYCDFQPCSILTEYQCNNGPCISLNKRCDSIKHCADGSDEIACDKCNEELAFLCDIGRCIPKRLRCDEHAHCEDGADEQLCTREGFSSCQDIWEAGFRKSSLYTMAGVIVQCEFDDIYDNHQIETVLNMDLKYHENYMFGFTYVTAVLYNDLSSKLESTINVMLFADENTTCIQKMKEACVPAFEARAELNDTSSECFCGIFNYKIGERIDYYDSIDACENRKPNSLLTSKGVSFLGAVGYRTIFNLGREIQIIAGPYICQQGFYPKDNDFVCDINGKHIPADLRCIYDEDNTGFLIGCRDGSHIKNCYAFECPENTVKCPGSYCIPLRFLCDGELQCPSGEDEENCGCESSDNEILIIYDEESTDEPDIDKFSRQFSTRTNIVRSLGYKASKPLQPFGITDYFLEIRDKEVDATGIGSLFECKYNIMARELLKSVRFTNDGNKGIILIENSETSKLLTSEFFGNVSLLGPEFKTYRLSENFNVTVDNRDETKKEFVKDVRVKRWQILNDVGAEYFNELCNVTTKVHCPDDYRCASSKICISIEQVCDGFIQCPRGDDEALCDFKCPDQCRCSGLIANCSFTSSNLTMISTISKNTRYLDFSSNVNLSSILEDSVLILPTLSILILSGCDIEVISRHGFDRVVNLMHLDLSFNNINTLSNYVFSSLKYLSKLELHGNFKLAYIAEYAFSGLANIQNLNFANAKLVKILAGSFSGLTLKKLDLSNNRIQEIEDFAFRDAVISEISFRGNSIRTFNKEIFTGLIGLNTLITPAFKFCCIRPNYVGEKNCYPKQDEFSSCDDLMRNSVLQFLIWLIGITALLGNLLTIVYRLHYDRQRLKLGFGIFVTNLAVADFMMGLYLLIIAIADSAFRKRYIFVDDYWRHSIWCNLAGILSTISSESSVLFLCLITLDRILVIKFPFGGVRISTKKAVVCVLFTWIFSSMVAIIPVVYVGYFKNEFYSKSGVCIALPLTRDRPAGWAYSLSVFVCLNFITFILVAVGQLSIFVEIRKSAGIATSTETARKRDLKVARNLLLVVGTDFLCWFPIGVLGMLALTGHVISGDVYAWAAVFILPVNSALNPILYTLTAIIGGKQFNPSTDEQSLTKLTKESGEAAFKCMAIGRRLTSRARLAGYVYMYELPDADVCASRKDWLTIAWKLAQTLHTLQSFSLGLKTLDINSVLLGCRDGKLTGAVKVKGDPFISYKTDDGIKSINDLGLLLKFLISVGEKNMK